jgi:hypothetical protein
MSYDLQYLNGEIKMIDFCVNFWMHVLFRV